MTLTTAAQSSGVIKFLFLKDEAEAAGANVLIDVVFFILPIPAILFLSS
jgi:hypothetical protein|tara:strand:- start:384 stop:530 length:147 start_codon:yes stop_codon:yes gene_type:complete